MIKARSSVPPISIGAMLLGGCTQKVVEIYVNPEDNIKPHLNADGNYNIIFIVNDQEHYMR